METLTIIKIAVLLVVLGLVAYFAYLRFSKPAKAPYQASSSSSGGAKDVEILYFFTDWCPHCKTAKPEVEHVRNEMNDTTVNGYKITFREVNCTTDTPEVDNLTRTYNVDGYPTIKLIKNNEVIDYDAKPNRDTLKQFILTSTS